MSRSTLRSALFLWAAMQAHGSWGVAFAPADVSTPRPVIAYLHGMWASPEQSCGTFIKAAAPFGWLVCPRGNAPLGQGRMWAGTGADALRQLHRALDAAGALAPGKLDRADGTLVGYSNGAYFAAEAACAEKGRWTGLVLLSMKLALDPARLRAAGVERIVLGAGDGDDAKASLLALATRLATSGISARFMSLGPGGHPFPPDMEDRMAEAIAWVRGAPQKKASSILF